MDGRSVSINSMKMPALTATDVVAPISPRFILQAPHRLQDLRSSSGEVGRGRSHSAGTHAHHGGRLARDLLDIFVVAPLHSLLGAAWMFGLVIVRRSVCILRWVTMEGKIGTGGCDECGLVSEPLNVGDVAPSHHILGAALIFLGVMLRCFSCTVRCVPTGGRFVCCACEPGCVEFDG
jgi:hypothetical protein